jgi:hypothetical protein
MDDSEGMISDNIEVVPVVVVSQTFPARPSSIPDIRDFVRRCLVQSPLSAEDTREVGETVSQALLEAAGPTGAISVSFRIFPDHVEVDVLKSGAQIGGAAGRDALSSLAQAEGRRAARDGNGGPGLGAPGDGGGNGSGGADGLDGSGPGSAGSLAAATSLAPGTSAARAQGGADGTGDGADGDVPADGDSESFADWMSSVLRREGLTMEAAARQLGVSVKTVSRWVGGATEPRLRDLRRIRELFGEIPFT